MTIEILVKPKGSGYRAIVKGYADCTADAPTQEEAIRKAQHEVEDWIAHAKRVWIEVDESHCLPNDGVGILANDPFFDEFLAEMSGDEKLSSTALKSKIGGSYDSRHLC